MKDWDNGGDWVLGSGSPKKCLESEFETVSVGSKSSVAEGLLPSGPATICIGEEGVLQLEMEGVIGLVHSSSRRPVCNLTDSHIFSRDFKASSSPFKINHHLCLPDLAE